MGRIADPRLDQILTTRAHPDLPAALTQPAYRLTRLLLAAHEWRDLSVFTDPMPHGEGFVAPVDRKWAITFDWSPGSGARNLALMRL